MRILGVDPGLEVTGYGVISVSDRASGSAPIRLLEAGIIKTGKRQGIAERLKEIHRSLEQVISEKSPDVLAIERLYTHYEHPVTAILMGHVRGVVCLLSGSHRIPLVSVAATHVKKSVTGKGSASKIQMQRMVQNILRLSVLPEPADVADALAVAITCGRQLGKDRR